MEIKKDFWDLEKSLLIGCNESFYFGSIRTINGGKDQRWKVCCNTPFVCLFVSPPISQELREERGSSVSIVVGYVQALRGRKYFSRVWAFAE